MDRLYTLFHDYSCRFVNSSLRIRLLGPLIKTYIHYTILGFLGQCFWGSSLVLCQLIFLDCWQASQSHNIYWWKINYIKCSVNKISRKFLKTNWDDTFNPGSPALSIQATFCSVSIISLTANWTQCNNISIFPFQDYVYHHYFRDLAVERW